jgi:integrase
MELIQKQYFNAYGDKLRKTELVKQISLFEENFHLEPNVIFNMDFSDIDYNDLIKWCDIYAIKYNIVRLLLPKSIIYYQIFLNKQKYVYNREKYIKSLTKEFKLLSTEKSTNFGVVVRHTYDEFGGEINLNNISSKDIFEKILKIKNSSYLTIKAVLLLFNFLLTKLNKLDTIIELEKIYNYTYNTNCFEKFKSQSAYRKNLIEYMKNKHELRLATTSAYPEETTRKKLEAQIHVMYMFEDNILKMYNIPDKMDPLQWFFKTCNIKQVEKLILDCSHSLNYRNDLVKSKNTTHHAKEYIVTCLSIFKGEYIVELPCKKEVNNLSCSGMLYQIENMRETPESIRRHFYEGEIEKIFENVQFDPMYTLLFRILHEVGLRIGALVKLKLIDFVNLDDSIKKEAKVLEKGRKYRTFTISDNIKQDLELYLKSSTLTLWLFPCHLDDTKHISTSSIQKKLKSIAKDVGFYGVHIHPHAFRHTLVNKLMENGNDMSKVSKFMGHSSATITEKYYWTQNIVDIVDSMNIPWLNKHSVIVNTEPEDEEYEDERVHLITSILLTSVGLMNEDQKNELKNKIPNIETIINTLYEEMSTIASSMSHDKGINNYI